MVYFLQSSSLVVCEVDESLKEKLRKFRFRKETNNAAILMKIDMEKQLVILEEEYEASVFLTEHYIVITKMFVLNLEQLNFLDNCVNSWSTATNMSMLMEGCPTPFASYSPVQWVRGCKPEQQMMYAGSKNQLVQAAELTKVFETRNVDDLTEEWLKNQLAFFR
ncbi:unnamed protein product [Menidia menidia]|uniref:Glia maturation factor n=1 Tax=Menidia menidia TaxID=238744 RepID=A0A8S4BKM0_9TELE|nr:unnamed protein product [Menidia menidia]